MAGKAVQASIKVKINRGRQSPELESAGCSVINKLHGVLLHIEFEGLPQVPLKEPSHLRDTLLVCLIVAFLFLLEEVFGQVFELRLCVEP